MAISVEEPCADIRPELSDDIRSEPEACAIAEPDAFARTQASGSQAE